jgi:hypothetical protein
MRYLELIYNGEIHREEKIINKILLENNISWLIDSEIENARIEIKNKTLIWNDGDFYSGEWNYGIFKKGRFFGIFENGIFEGGEFLGKFISGIKKSKS